MTDTTWKAIGRAGNLLALNRGAEPTHTIWQAPTDEPIYTVLPDGETPGDQTGGYYRLQSALGLRGLVVVPL